MVSRSRTMRSWACEIRLTAMAMTRVPATAITTAAVVVALCSMVVAYSHHRLTWFLAPHVDVQHQTVSTRIINKTNISIDHVLFRSPMPTSHIQMPARRPINELRPKTPQWKPTLSKHCFSWLHRATQDIIPHHIRLLRVVCARRSFIHLKHRT